MSCLPSPSHHHVSRWYGYEYHSQSWVVYGIVLPPLNLGNISWDHAWTGNNMAMAMRKTFSVWTSQTSLRHTTNQYKVKRGFETYPSDKIFSSLPTAMAAQQKHIGTKWHIFSHSAMYSGVTVSPSSKLYLIEDQVPNAISSFRGLAPAVVQQPSFRT